MKSKRAIRVVVANRPKLMREAVLATIGEQPDVEIVTEVANEWEMERVIERTHPDVLVVALGRFDRLPDACYSILQNHPFLKIIGIAPDRNSTLFYWASLNIHSHRLETSQEELLKALRRKG